MEEKLIEEAASLSLQREIQEQLHQEYCKEEEKLYEQYMALLQALEPEQRVVVENFFREYNNLRAKREFRAYLMGIEFLRSCIK